MINLRNAIPGDLDKIYAISHATGNMGKDASSIYSDNQLMGHIYAAPYLKFEHDLCIVAEDSSGVVGYVVGTPDSVAFARTLEGKWWPKLRADYAQPDPEQMRYWSKEQRRINTFYCPETTPASVTAAFPAHLHMNLYARVQGQGIGSRLFAAWSIRARQLGAKAVHVGANSENLGGVNFWEKCGFSELSDQFDLAESRTAWMGKIL